MSDRSRPDPDIVEVPFIFIPDGAPMPDAVRYFRDPIVLRARFEPEPSRVPDAGQPVPTMPSHGAADRLPGAYRVVENGPLSMAPRAPGG